MTVLSDDRPTLDAATRPRLSPAPSPEVLPLPAPRGPVSESVIDLLTGRRADVLPVDDFGVREGWRVAAGLDAQPKPKELARIGEAWAPWRSAAAWYLWRAADAAKRSAFKPQ